MTLFQLRHTRGDPRVVSLALLLGAAAAAAAQTGAVSQPGNVPEPIAENYYAAGERVETPAPAAGDVVVAGRQVSIPYPVSGDVLAAGWRVSLTAAAADDVRVAGNELLLDAPVEGDVTAAGNEVTIGSRARVGGRTWLSGRLVRVDGSLAREVRIAAQTVQIAGEIRQPARIVAERLQVLDTARILAPVTYEGATPAEIARGATLAHALAYKHIAAGEAQASRWPSGLSSVVFAIHLFIGGMLLFLLVPSFAAAPADTLRTQPWRSLLAGVMLAATVPFVALLFLISLVGIPVGLTVGALYLIALFLAVLTTAFSIGHAEARLFHASIASRSRQALFLLAGVVTLAVLRSLPVVGGGVVFVSVLFGLGALGLWAYRAYRQIPAAAAAK